MPAQTNNPGASLAFLVATCRPLYSPPNPKALTVEFTLPVRHAGWHFPTDAVDQRPHYVRLPQEQHSVMPALDGMIEPHKPTVSFRGPRCPDAHLSRMYLREVDGNQSSELELPFHETCHGWEFVPVGQFADLGAPVRTAFGKVISRASLEIQPIRFHVHRTTIPVSPFPQRSRHDMTLRIPL